MPYAFRQSGWLLGIATLVWISMLNIYTMLLLVKTRGKLESLGHRDIYGYGDVGRIIGGKKMENFVNVCIVICQVGFATAYIIFIAANINNIAGTYRGYTCLACIPFLAVLIQLRDMTHLSPFSLIADTATITGLLAVMCQDFEEYQSSHEQVFACDFSNFLYVASVSLYALEGVALVLPLESSCKERSWFPSLLKGTVITITLLMAVFGCLGYFAFGSATKAPITLNLVGIISTVVKLALCVGLYLTFPIMMIPVNDVMEDLVFGDGTTHPNKIFRVFVVFCSALVAYLIPDFGKFLGLVGASTCTILGFILPCCFHLKAFDRCEMRSWEWAMDVFLIVFGVIFGVLGTRDALAKLTEGGS